MDGNAVERQMAEYDCRRAGVHLGSVDFERLMDFVAVREHETAPQELWRRFQSGHVSSPALLAVLLPDVWRFKLDDCTLPREAWREMFAAVPYTSDRVLTRRPRRGRWLYRGATPEHRDGLSWTTDHAVASYFAAHRQAHGKRGTVWECFFPPQRMHAYLADEKEYVADVRDLPIADLGHDRPRRVLGLRIRPAQSQSSRSRPFNALRLWRKEGADQ